jgi:hypothetical protein
MSEPIRDWQATAINAQQALGKLTAEFEVAKQLHEQRAAMIKALQAEIQALKEQNSDFYRRLYGNPDALHERAQQGELHRPEQVFRQGGWVER